MCSKRTLGELAKPAPRSISGIPGQAEDETAPARQHRTADRLAEKAGERRVSISAVRHVLWRVSALLPIRGGGSGRNPRAAPFDASASTPRGASGLGGDPTPVDPRSYSNTLFTHPLHQEIRASVGSPTRTGGRARGACGEGACDRCARPPVRRTLAPPFGLVTGPFLPVMRSRRLAKLAVPRRGAWCIALMRHTFRPPWG